ncbi:hypothetical protein J437_LFUL008444 [Ladona fulva]|uniref:Reverse transcriptase domain-containing protein n=1 Tax=Ladona fulva TaxID=123851 RepID=A0A8K0K8V3_LADFU|nr:hypothetical protein J437_LFUL008444 [Ladona fulva]
MDDLLQGIDCTGTLLDDIIITGPTRQEHLQNLRQVLKRLKQAWLLLKLAKCRFMQKSVNYLGHRIDQQGIHQTEEKVEAIKKTPTPRNVKDLRAFLGSINFHEHFIPQLHACCADLYHLTSKRQKWEWTEVHEQAFQKTKDLLSSQATVVPYDETRPLVLACDASERGVGTVLFQTKAVGQDRPIAYASQTLTKGERHYAPIDRETLALRDLPKVANNRLQRWALYLNEYNHKVEYQPGKENQCADVLSWLPMPTTIKSSRERKFVNLVMQGKVEDLALSTKILQQGTAKDPVLSKIQPLWT